jgi:hypothetical protein
LPACLYCKESDRPFTSEEHVIPESLGNQGRGDKPPILLPKGVVCDTCNHSTLSQLDDALIRFMPISLMRTFYGVESKRGRLPESRMSNATLRMFTKGNILFESNSKKAFVHDGQGRIDMKLLGQRPMTPKYCRTLTRALFKMTLGCMYIDQPEVAFSERYDPVRRMILGLDEFHGYFVMLNKVTPPDSTRDAAGLSYGFYENEDGRQSTWCEFAFFGFVMLTDLEIRKPQHPEIIPKDVATIFEF